MRKFKNKLRPKQGQGNDKTHSKLSDEPFPDGLKVLHDCSDAVVDICFVHGLAGDRERTWTAGGQSAPWPQTLLPSKLTKARILTYGYDAYIVQKGHAGGNRLNDHAMNLVNDLTTDRERDDRHASSRPIIFVAHSLGGLVCKQAILLSRDNPERHLKDIFNCTIGIIFMGTPHRGSWMADWGKKLASAAALVKSVNESPLEILKINNQGLDMLQVSFWSMIQQQRNARQPLNATCFFEELPLGLAEAVVPKASAILEDCNNFSIHANHSDMVKFASAEDNGFRRVLGELVRWTKEAGNLPPRQIEELSRTRPRDCLKSLAFPQMDRFHEVGRASRGTCEWLLQHETYNRWATRDLGLLWIKGKPGSGKSTLLKYALGNSGAGDKDLVLKFFFHDRGDELQKSRLGLFQSLLHQVLQHAPDALQDLVAGFQKKREENGEPGKDWRWHEQELQLFFESALPKVLQARSVWLYIDALDESGNGNAVMLVEIFKSLLKSLKPQPRALGKFRICLSCRHHPILDVDKSIFEICTEDENQKDISTFVHDRLASFDKRSSKIPDMISQRARGVFQWAHLVVEKVLDLERGGYALKKIEAEVDSLPTDLRNLYQKLTEDMKPGSDSLKLVQWICFARRPLTIGELPWAMVIDADCPHQSLRACQSADDYVSDPARIERQVQTLSCGLAEVSKGRQPVIQFIHQSVKDFFLGEGLLALSGCKTSSEAALKAHFRFSNICMRYLEMEEISRSNVYENANFPFLRYATTSWVSHIQQCDAESTRPEDFLELFYWPSNTLMELWVHAYRALDPFHLDCPNPGTSLLHVASRHRLLRLLTAILKRGNQISMDINTRDGWGWTPLSLAANEGHEAIVKLLLGTGKVDIDAKDEQGRTTLSLAAERGREAIVKLLLGTNKIDVDPKDEYGRTPLSLAADEGHKAIVKLLLGTNKIDVNLKDKYGRTPLLLAAGHGYEGIVKLLLGTGKVNIDAKEKHGMTPLSLAADRGHEAIVKLLLGTNKVDIDAKDKYGRTPLWLAALRGNEAIVKLLLDTGEVNINTKNRRGETPQLVAAKYGYKDIVKLFIDADKVNGNVKDKEAGRRHRGGAVKSERKAVVKTG
ncbi:ankyrin repeat domain-containing protein 17 [Cladorrhinum sp. PSN332]|nr:ankyrin repeat domain-containing protein 17 [Cladorrhinum sp. PSN332]